MCPFLSTHQSLGDVWAASSFGLLGMVLLGACSAGSCERLRFHFSWVLCFFDLLFGFSFVFVKRLGFLGLDFLRPLLVTW